MISASTLKRLSALNLPTEAFQEVLSILGEALQADEERRAGQRRRTNKHRGKPDGNVTDDVTVTLPQRDCNSDKSPPTYNTPPKSEKPKKVSRISARAVPWPPDFVLTAEDRQYGRDKRGWDSVKTDFEFERFKNHALARDRRQKDWHAAWRNWVTSPFQVVNNEQQPTLAFGANSARSRPAAHDTFRAGMAAALAERSDSRLSHRDGEREGLRPDNSDDILDLSPDGTTTGYG